ncbi:hypothetical protein NH286_03390 [Anaerococcus sp. NML200574]|uniref:hypothetical protein n=1 Tax=Anaerococcus sp. NML200574 TaxID=2954486 RepID=UPI002238212B|nr:hypothetical protein [Anaerococcus sp. NML200574]MCW6678197.1 hypothetical protein [Anaerococcus sp. NML200574]
MKVKELKETLDIFNDEVEIFNFVRIDGEDYSLEIKGVGAVEDEGKIKLFIFSKDE